MGRYYEKGEVKLRPGVYRRYDTDDVYTLIPDAINGYGAIVIQADYGPLNEAVEFDCSNRELAKQSITELYGTGGGVDIALSYIDGGLTDLAICRIGEGGEKGTLELKAGDAKAVTLTALYPGVKEFTVSIRSGLTKAGGKEMVVYEGTTQLEVIFFKAKDGAEAKALEKAVNETSKYFTAVAEEDVQQGLSIVSQAAVTGGSAPTVTNTHYATGFKELNQYPFNTIATDTLTADVERALVEFVQDRHKRGKESIAVVGCENPAIFDVLIKAANAYDSELIVYFPDSFYEADGTLVKGAAAVARASGVIASTPTDESIEHKKMPGAVALANTYDDDEYDEAAQAGMLLLSRGDNGEIWFDTGYNTLKHPADNQDAGWKKIKRTRVRQEMFNRLDRALEPEVGRHPNNSDTIDDIRTKALAVLNAMADEQKIAAGPAFDLGPEGYDADYAYFVINAYDMDALSKIYLNYKFRYAQNS